MSRELVDYLEKVKDLTRLDINNLSIPPEQFQEEFNKLDYAISQLLPEENKPNAKPPYNKQTIKDAFQLLGIDEETFNKGNS